MSEQPQDAATKTKPKKRGKQYTTLNIDPELLPLLRDKWHAHCFEHKTDIEFCDFMDEAIRNKIL